MLDSAFLAFAVLSLVFSGLTFFRIRVLEPLLVPTFLIGWLRGELALHTLAFEALVVAAAVGLGGVLESESGPAAVALCFGSWALLIGAFRRSLGTARQINQALAPIGLSIQEETQPLHGFPNPFRFGHPEVERLLDLEYGAALAGDQGGRNRLDIVRPRATRAGDLRPVLLQVHGGAWMIGDKREQGRPLMTQLAESGWVCVAINYRLSPAAKMPAHIIDVKRSIAWIRQNIAEYGGDPDFICITGGSAGGHLCSLAALTPNDPRFQPGFESVDTRLAACVPFYGVFDFLDRAGDRPLGDMVHLIGDKVFPAPPEADPELWDSVCPVARVHADAPPFFLIQGTHDSLVFAEEATTFAAALSAKSVEPVLHAQLKGAQHAFEIFHSPRSEATVRGAVAFLEKIRAERQERH